MKVLLDLDRMRCRTVLRLAPRMAAVMDFPGALPRARNLPVASACLTWGVPGLPVRQTRGSVRERTQAEGPVVAPIRGRGSSAPGLVPGQDHAVGKRPGLHQAQVHPVVQRR